MDSKILTQETFVNFIELLLEKEKIENKSKWPLMLT
jgi:hypothetical protein